MCSPYNYTAMQHMNFKNHRQFFQEPAMSAITLISPFASAVRPFLGFGLVAALLMMFKPFLGGVLRAFLMVTKPATVTVNVAAQQDRVRGTLLLNRMASELDRRHPNLASELRNLACRDCYND